MGWWVNDPNMKRSTKFPTKEKAQKVAKQVKNASVSKTPQGQHKAGCLSAIIVGLGTISGVSYVSYECYQHLPF
jgi:hypothetical protein